MTGVKKRTSKTKTASGEKGFNCDSCGKLCKCANCGTVVTRCNRSHCSFSSLFSHNLFTPTHWRLAFSYHHVQSISSIIHPIGDLHSLVTKCNYSHCLFSYNRFSSLIPVPQSKSRNPRHYSGCSHNIGTC